MQTKKEDINPFANEDGSPIEGKEPEFYKWMQDRSKMNLDSLPKDQRDAKLKSEEALNKRMDS